MPSLLVQLFPGIINLGQLLFFFSFVFRFSSKNDLPKYCDTLPPAAKSRKLFKTFSHGCEVFSIVM